MRVLVTLLLFTTFSFSQSSSGISLLKSYPGVENYRMFNFDRFLLLHNSGASSTDDLKRMGGFVVDPPELSFEVQGYDYTSSSDYTGGIASYFNNWFFLGNIQQNGTGLVISTYRATSSQITYFNDTVFNIPGKPDFLEFSFDNLMLISSDGSDTVQLFDAINPYQPVHIGSSSPTSGNLYEIRSSNTYLIAGSQNSIEIVNIDSLDRTLLTPIATLPSVYERPLFVNRNDTLIVADKTSLHIYDISDLDSPNLILTKTISDTITNLTISDSEALLHTLTGSKLTAYDISDPTNMVEAGYYQFLHAPLDLTSTRTEVFVMHRDSLSILTMGDLTIDVMVSPLSRVVPLYKTARKPVPFTIRNIGTGPAEINGFSSNSPFFEVTNDTVNLLPGERHVFDVIFVADSVPTVRSGTITVQHNGLSNPSEISVTAVNKEDPVLFHVTDIWDEWAPLGGSRDSWYIITNDSFQDTVRVDRGYIIGTVFEGGVINSFVLPPRQGIDVPFTFRPNRPGYVTEHIVIEYEGVTRQIEVRGYGEGPFLEVLTDTLDFAQSQIGTVGEQIDYLQNIGRGDVLITNIVPPSGPFSINLDSLNITQSDSLRLQATFTPTQTGVFSDSIIIEHNTITSPTIIHLTGEGVFGNASNMLLLGGRDTPGSTEGLALTSKTTFLADSGNGIVAMNISNPQNITVNSELPITAPLHRIEVEGSVGYAVAENGSFYTLNLSDTANISLYDNLPLPGTPNDIALQGLYTYVSAGAEGLRIINISDPSNPFQLSFLNLPGYASGVAVDGNYAYVASGDSGLQVVDISNLFNPFIAAFLSLPGRANELWKDGNRLFVTLGNNGVQEVDITDPLQPQALRLVDAIGEAVDIALSGDTLYVAALDDGVRVHDLSQNGSPEIAFYELPSKVYSMQARSDTVYAAAGNSGLFILQLGGGFVGTGETSVSAPITQFKLHQNYPNPFNPETRIGFDLPQRSSVELVVYDLLGRKVRTLKNGTLTAGNHQATWDGRDDVGNSQVSGVYVYKLQYETEKGKSGSLSGKMVLLK